MKKIIALALCALVSLAAFAAAPLVTISDTGNTYVDGVNVGQPADAIANNPKLASPIQTALVAFVATVKAEQAAATKAAQEGAAKAITAHTNAKAAEIDALKAEVAKLRAEIAALKPAPVEAKK